MKNTIIPPIPTPFVSEQISRDHLKSNIDKLLINRTGGVLVLGANGDSVFLSEAETGRTQNSSKPSCCP